MQYVRSRKEESFCMTLCSPVKNKLHISKHAGHLIACGKDL